MEYLFYILLIFRCDSSWLRALSDHGFSRALNYLKFISYLNINHGKTYLVCGSLIELERLVPKKATTKKLTQKIRPKKIVRPGKFWCQSRPPTIWNNTCDCLWCSLDRVTFSIIRHSIIYLLLNWFRKTTFQCKIEVRFRRISNLQVSFLAIIFIWITLIGVICAQCTIIHVCPESWPD